MTTNTSADPHVLWVGRCSAPTRPDDVLAVVDAHRRRRGPYTAAGDLVRAILPTVVIHWPALVARHDIEILAVAPELAGTVTCERETLTSAATTDERTRFYPRARTRRIAHGLVDLVNEIVERSDNNRTLVVERVDQADPTDAEWLAILLRRAHPRLRLVLTAAEALPPGELETAALTHATTRASAAAVRGRTGRVELLEAARRFVDSDGTSDDPVLQDAYDTLDNVARAALHEIRAAELESMNEASLRLGAIPFHRSRGTDPTVAGAAALLAAVEHCVLMGFYHAVIELGRECLQLLDWDRRPEDCWLVVAKVATALTALDRPDEAADLYDEACAATTLPSVHLQAAYGRAMLYTRFYDAERLDHQRAKAHINTAIAISQLMPEGERRAFNLTFNENGLALIEMHLGDVDHALELVTAGLARLDEEIGADQQTLHRSVLRYNRAQLLTRAGPAEAAVAEYGRAIDADPHHSEYYFERAAVHRQLGQVDQALADYEAAIALSPPYPEPHYNLADLAIECDDLALALAHLDRVLDLEPDFVDAYVSRAGVHRELGDSTRAAHDVAAGLSVDARYPELLCLRGLLALETGNLAGARADLDAALEVEPTLVAAWANRAVVAFEADDIESAVVDLNAAIALEDRPDLRLNRAPRTRVAGTPYRGDHRLRSRHRRRHPQRRRPSRPPPLPRCPRRLTRAHRRSWFLAVPSNSSISTPGRAPSMSTSTSAMPRSQVDVFVRRSLETALRCRSVPTFGTHLLPRRGHPRRHHAVATASTWIRERPDRRRIAGVRRRFHGLDQDADIGCCSRRMPARRAQRWRGLLHQRRG